MLTRFRAATAAHGGLLLVLGLFGALAVLPGCSRPGREERTTVQRHGADDAEWTWLQAASKRLDRKRAELAGAGSPELRSEVDRLAGELDRRLVAFINAHAGDPPSDRQRAAIRMKSGEDRLLARRFIEEAGDYRRAIEIYETALAADPDNARLRQELKAARDRRYVTAGRFAQLREGMSQDEVRGRLGPPNRQDVRDYPERGVTAWFYPKDASGAAAAVWFHDEGGVQKAYLLDFDAIKPSAAASGRKE